MGIYVYAIVHDATQCLVFKKKKYGRYFQYHDPNAQIQFDLKFGNGKKLRGSEAYCFPGGGLKGGEAALTGAIREFKEETGFDLGGTPYTTIENNFTFNGGNDTVHAVFFDVSANNFNTIHTTCGANLVAKQNGVAGILTAVPSITTMRRANQLTLQMKTDAENALVTANVNIEDDEQESVHQTSLTIAGTGTAAGGTISGTGIAGDVFKNPDMATDWFYAIAFWAKNNGLTFVT
jgi:hypothetical protein